MARRARSHHEVVGRLGDDEVLLTNLPCVMPKELQSEMSVQSFLQRNVHKDLQVKAVSFVDALHTENLKKRTAYIRVKVGSKRQAHLVKTSLRQTWLQDSLVKVKTREDAKSEAFDNRTVIINGLPKHLKAEQILDYFGQSSGAIVGIEMPKENSKLRDLRNALS